MHEKKFKAELSVDLDVDDDLAEVSLTNSSSDDKKFSDGVSDVGRL